MAVLAAVLIIYVLLAQTGAADAATWGVLTAGAVLGTGVLVGAVFAGRAEARSASRQYEVLRRAVAAGQTELQDLLERLGRGESVEQPSFTHHAPPEGDVHGRLAYEINVLLWQTKTVAAQGSAQAASAAMPSEDSRQDSKERVEVFVNLARRLQSLVHRAISMLDRLENEVEDPDLLKGLFHVDHLATRIRRHAENVAVLGGSVSRRQWTRPVTLTEVLRSSIAEVEDYSRVKLVPPIEGTVRGHAVADVIHLLAELVENATAFSDPHTQVLLRSQRVAAGLAVEVEDRGLGMPLEEQDRYNQLLAEPDRIDIGKLLADGRIGLYVVSALARRHGLAVRLQNNIFGGIQAILIIPRGLVGDEPEEAPHQAADMARPVQAAAPPQPAAQPVGPPPAPQQAARPVGPPPAAQQAARPVGPSPAPQQATRPVAHQAAAQPLPQAAPMPMASRHAGPVEAAQPYGRGPSRTSGPADDERPPLPQRNAQEHLVPQLRDAPGTHRGNEQEAEHDPGLMATFQRGFGLAENEPDDNSAESSR
ncbi:sensor histidine kinase [Streptomyces azureus]|uniref:histidine kinase n=1 Tax=Streptomyces azureus TaxID=146537 RepID=A0A0K8PY07_STRAJ|nr:ATP-binding protein [Streptomyces azureus]GAP52593.1 membrane protein [Streptomyces azureus]